VRDKQILRFHFVSGVYKIGATVIRTEKKTCILCIIPTFLILTIRFSNKPSLGNEMTYTVSSGALNSAPTKSLGNDKVSVTAFRFQSATRAGACADRQTDGLIIRCWQVRGLCLPLIGYEMPGPDVPQCHYRSLTNNNNAVRLRVFPFPPSPACPGQTVRRDLAVTLAHSSRAVADVE